MTLTSCEKDEVRATLTPTTATTLSASAANVVLQQTNSEQTAVTFSWTPVTYAWSNNEQTAVTPVVTYALEIDKQGNNFAKPAVIDMGTGTSSTKAVLVKDLNSSLNSLGLAPGVATPLEARLKSYVAANSSQYSPTIALTATSYKMCVAPNTNRWSIIGPAGVDWSTDVALAYDCDTRTYRTTRSLNAGEFKFRLNSDWATNYGSTATRSSAGTAPLDTSPNNNITVPTAGTYTIILDLNAMTYTLTR